MYTEQVTQHLGICAPVNPQTLNNNSKLAGGIDMTLFKRGFFVVEIGAVTGGGSINLQLVEDTAANLGSATNLGGSNTSLTALTTSNKQYTFEARTDQMTKRYLGLKITETGSQNVLAAVIGFGAEPDNRPGNANNDSSVATQKVVS